MTITKSTYHGITGAECLRCGYSTTDVTTLEIWNDGTSGECIDCGYKYAAILWTLVDAPFQRITLSDPDNGPATFDKEAS